MAKIGFNAGAIKSLFTKNVEKLLFVGVVFVFLLFVYSAIGREKIDITPEDLTSAVEDAKQKIASTDATGIDEELPIKNYPELAMGIRREIDDKFYQHSIRWDRPPFERGETLRRQPEIYPVREVRGTPGYGSAGPAGMGMGMTPGMEMMPGMPGMPMGGAAAPQQALGRRWVVLTGLVDVAKQIEAFKEALPSMSIPGRTQPGGMAGAEGMMPGNVGGMSGGPASPDDPNWIYVRVERAEISNTGAGQLAWELLNTREQRQKVGNIQYGGDMSPGMGMGMEGAMGGGSDVIESKYVVSSWVTFPLPSLHNYTWGAEAAHLPDIPLRPKQAAMMGPDGVLPGGVDPARKPTDIPDDPLAAGAPGMPGMGMPGMEAGMMPGMMPGMEGMGMPGMPVKKADVGLFRFLDFTVDPGKHYRYRVKLVLANPNYGLSVRYIETPELAKERWIETDWSEPTAPVSVPRDSRLLVGEVKSSRYVTIEPSTSLMLIHFDEMTGKESSAEKSDLLRGQLVNFEVEAEKAPAAGMMPGMMPGMEGMAADPMMDPMAMEGAGAPARRPPRRRQPEKEEEKEFVEYRTGHVVLDMAGGNRLPGSDRALTEPSKLLLLDPDGNLVIRTELDDSKEFKKYHKEEAPKTKAPAMSPEEMMGMPPEMVQPRRRGR